MPGEIDKELVTAVKAARGGKPMQFAFVPKGPEGQLFVAKKVPAKKVAELKKEVGANIAFLGRVVGEDGKLVFELVKDPPPTLLPQLKKRLKEDAGLTLPLEVRLKADAEDAGPEDEGEEKPPTAPPGPGAPPPPAPDAVADWKAKLAEWSPAIKAAIAAKHPKAAQIQKFLQEAAGLAKPGGDYVSAILRLKAAVTLASAATAPDAPPQGGPPPAPDAAADWKAKLAEWSPAIKKAIAEKHPKAADIAKYLQDAAGMAKPGGDYVAAILRLKAAAALATGAAPGTAPPPPTAATPGGFPPEAVKAYAAAHGATMTKLKALARELAGIPDPETKAAILELNAVMKQITAEPKTPQQVAELVRYLETDDVIADVSEMAGDIRTPLLKTLAALKA